MAPPEFETLLEAMAPERGGDAGCWGKNLAPANCAFDVYCCLSVMPCGVDAGRLVLPCAVLAIWGCLGPPSFLVSWLLFLPSLPFTFQAFPCSHCALFLLLPLFLKNSSSRKIIQALTSPLFSALSLGTTQLSVSWVFLLGGNIT